MKTNKAGRAKAELRAKRLALLTLNSLRAACHMVPATEMPEDFWERFGPAWRLRLAHIMDGIGDPAEILNDLRS